MTLRRLGKPGALALFLFVLTAAYIAAVLPFPAFYDEGLIVRGAERILGGQHPYVDFTSGYPPGQFYTIALVFKLFGTSLLAERVWDSAWRLAIVAAAVWLARELAGKDVKPLPLVCCAALVGAARFRLYPMVTATLPCLCALSCALAFVRTRNHRWIFGAGLFLGCTALYRHDLAACAVIVVFASVLRHRRAVAWLAAGIVLIAGPAVAYLAATIPQHILQQAFLEFPSVNAVARHLPLLDSPSSLLLDLLLPVAIIAFVAFDARRAPVGRRAPLVTLAAMAGLTLILATQRLDTIHAFPSLVLCMVILASFAPSTLPRRGLIALVVLSYGVLPLLEWTGEIWVIRAAPASGIARADPVRIPAGQAQAVRYIQNHLPRGEKLYVGTTTHSRISFNDAIFPFLADRPQATRYDMWLPGVTDSVPVQSEILNEVESNAIRYVVLFDAPRFYERNLSSVDSGVRILDEYLNRRYREVAVFGRYRILERAAY